MKNFVSDKDSDGTIIPHKFNSLTIFYTYQLISENDLYCLYQTA